MKTLFVLALALTSANASASANLACDQKTKAAALAHMAEVDSTGHFSIAGPTYDGNVAFFDVADYSAFGYRKYRVNVTIDHTCHILDVSAIDVTGGGL